MTKVYQKLMQVQSRLKAPKGCENKFGGYRYRKAEDILEAVKPILADVGAVVRVSDEIVQVGDRFYVKACAEFVDAEDGAGVVATAFAREALEKKGMDAAQVTGSSSSYARKYALNGLFAIDDSDDDPDATNRHGQEGVKSAPQSAPRPAPAQPAVRPAPGAPAPAQPRPAASKAAASSLAKRAWAAFRTLPLSKTMSDAQRNASFLEIVKGETGKVQSASLTDAEWEKVIAKIEVLGTL